MYIDSAMKIEPKNDVTIRDLFEGYINNHECEANSGVYAYSGRLCVRPEYQRSFVYDSKKSTAVIETILLNRPLGLMYWNHNQNNTYDMTDGQQRTISICDFAEGTSSIEISWLNDGKRINIDMLEHKFPRLAERFWNYHLMVQVCEHGSKDEILDWFKTINIQGEPLSNQELRNVNYTGSWLTDAKHYFSKSSQHGTCPAEQVGGNYTNKKAYRQEILEQVLKWITCSKRDSDICEYMENHYKDKNAKELWDYFNNVISWASEIFPVMDASKSRKIEWGILYNLYKDYDYDPDEMTELFNKLIEAKQNGELQNISEAKIVEYCFSRDESLLSPRKFSENDRLIMYNRQKGCCGDCGKPFNKNEMHAHHIVSWYNGGRTILDNGIMLCPECHHQRHM